MSEILCKEEKRVIRLWEAEDFHTAVIEAKIMSEKAGFDMTSQVLISTVVSELATNIIKYAETGEISIEILHNAFQIGIEITATDSGPGIPDIEKAVEDHFTTRKNSLGLGLASLKRIMDEHSIKSEVNKGTTIVTRKWRNIDGT